MKKIILVIALVLCLAMGLTLLVGCNSEKDILVISRESGSGTREAFDTLVKNSSGDGLSKKADGTVRDAVVSTANILSSTGNVMTKVANVASSIGYISLGSVNNTIKTISVDGVVASAENVNNGSYKLQRPFVIMTAKNVAPTVSTADFLSYLKSNQAQAIVKSNKFVEQSASNDYVAPASPLSGNIIIKGSTSVDPLMDKLIGNYLDLGGANVAAVSFAKDAEASAQGVSAAKADTTGTVIGMASSAVKPADQSSLDYFNLALDAVAVIVHNSNTLNNISIANLYNIFTGAITKFSSIV